MDERMRKAKSEAKTPQLFNGLVISIFVYWALWVSASVVMRLVG